MTNTEYQRSGGLWPAPAKSYFIDTIIKEFPFPKVYFHERIDMKTKRPCREIVDGQQRLSTIVDFVEDKFALGSNAGEMQGKRFSDLMAAVTAEQRPGIEGMTDAQMVSSAFFFCGSHLVVAAAQLAEK